MASVARIEGTRLGRQRSGALLQLYLYWRGQDGIPTRIVLDFDGTNDPCHGHQEGMVYHCYYPQHMLHPLLVFDGATDQLITAIVRPGTCHTSGGRLAVLKCLIRLPRARWPAIPIEVRGDSGSTGQTPRVEAMAAALAEQVTQPPAGWRSIRSRTTSLGPSAC